jgi:hypothetical protein
MKFEIRKNDDTIEDAENAVRVFQEKEDNKFIPIEREV